MRCSSTFLLVTAPVLIDFKTWLMSHDAECAPTFTCIRPVNDANIWAWNNSRCSNAGSIYIPAFCSAYWIKSGPQNAGFIPYSWIVLYVVSFQAIASRQTMFFFKNYTVQRKRNTHAHFYEHTPPKNWAGTTGSSLSKTWDDMVLYIYVFRICI